MNEEKQTEKNMADHCSGMDRRTVQGEVAGECDAGAEKGRHRGAGWNGLRTVESTDELFYLVTPPHPKDSELADEALKAFADGATLPDERRKNSTEFPGHGVD